MNDLHSVDQNDNELQAFFDATTLGSLILVSNPEGDLVLEYHIEFLTVGDRSYFSDALAKLETLFNRETIENVIFEYPYHHFIVNGDLVDEAGHLYPIS